MTEDGSSREADRKTGQEDDRGESARQDRKSRKSERSAEAALGDRAVAPRGAGEGRRILIIVGIVVVVLAAAAGIYTLLVHQRNVNAEAKAAAAATCDDFRGYQEAAQSRDIEVQIHAVGRILVDQTKASKPVKDAALALSAAFSRGDNANTVAAAAASLDEECKAIGK